MARSFVEANAQRLDGTFATISTPITMACWFYDDSGATNDRNMFQVQDSGDANRYFRLGRSEAASNQVQISSNFTSSFQFAVNGTYATNTWHHAAGVVATTTSRFAYLNGNQGVENTGTTNASTGINSITIGREGDVTPGDGWAGNLAEVAVWDVALTANEILALASSYAPSLIRPRSLVFYAPLIRGDASGNDKAIWSPNSGLLTSNSTAGEVGNFPHPQIIYPGAQPFKFAAAAGLTQTQDQFRFYNDDGVEAAATAIAAQNTNISQASSIATIVRIQVNNAGDAPSQQMVLQAKITAQPDSEYRDVPVAP